MKNKSILFSKLFHLNVLCKGDLISVKPGYQKDFVVLSKDIKNHVYYISHWINKKVIHYEIYSKETFHYVEPLQSGYLLVRGWSDGPEDKNAYVYSENGKIKKNFYAGDGIDDCQVDNTNTIWISYGDEGIFGDQLIGRRGVVCMDDEGTIQIPPIRQLVTNKELPPIDSCYTMNVTSLNEVWVCFYSGRAKFPLIRIKNKQVYNYGETYIKNPETMALYKNIALFVSDGEKLIHMDLDSMNKREVVPIDDNGIVLNFDLSIGRDCILWGICNNNIYYSDISNGSV